MIEHLGVDDITKNYLVDLQQSARVFRAAQILDRALAGPGTFLGIDGSTLFESEGPARLSRKENGSFLLEQYARDPIPYLSKDALDVWVPKIEFDTTQILTSVRPTDFEVADRIMRYDQNRLRPGEKPFGAEVFRVAFSFIQGDEIRTIPGPELFALVGKGPDRKRINLNGGNDNQYARKALDYQKAESLLKILEQLLAPLPVVSVPYIHTIIVDVDEVKPYKPLSPSVAGLESVLQYGNWPQGPDQSNIVYETLANLAAKGCKRAILARTMDEAGRICAFRIALPAQNQS